MKYSELRDTEKYELIKEITDWELWRNKEDGLFVIIDLVNHDSIQAEMEDVQQLQILTSKMNRILEREQEEDD